MCGARVRRISDLPDEIIWFLCGVMERTSVRNFSLGFIYTAFFFISSVESAKIAKTHVEVSKFLLCFFLLLC